MFLYVQVKPHRDLICLLFAECIISFVDVKSVIIIANALLRILIMMRFCCFCWFIAKVFEVDLMLLFKHAYSPFSSVLFSCVTEAVVMLRLE